MRFEIPDFTLLTALIPNNASLKGRVVIFHFPTNTILELVESSNMLVNYVSPRYEWERINKYGEITNYTFFVHRFITDDLMDVFEKAKIWYQNMMDWMDDNNDSLDDFLNDRKKGSDDLPN